MMATHWRSALDLDAHARRARSHSSREALENGHMRALGLASRVADCRHSLAGARREEDDDPDDGDGDGEDDEDEDEDDDARDDDRATRREDDARTTRGATETGDARVDVVG